jgi:Ser/Thr protein kinase RdoA (MazF antagonist)
MTSTHPPSHPYDALTPEVILAAVETYGVRATGALLALNSYENRVYRVDIEDAAPLVAKFYRPGRWSDETILEEHAFAQLLAEHEIPAVAPLAGPAGTLGHFHGFRFAVFPWARGRAPELNNADDRRLMGRYLGRLHRLGAAGAFRHRRRLTIEEFGTRSLAFLQDGGFVPEELRAAYLPTAHTLLNATAERFAEAGSVAAIRLHGDFHLGNVLWTDTGPHIVDFDDCMTGPAVQDLWMLLSGDRDETEPQLADLLDGYSEFMDFNPAELRLIEALRSLRLLHYSAWLAARFDDPAFPIAFPWFNSRRYWEDQVLTLKQQLAALEEPPLAWRPKA